MSRSSKITTGSSMDISALCSGPSSCGRKLGSKENAGSLRNEERETRMATPHTRACRTWIGSLESRQTLSAWKWSRGCMMRSPSTTSSHSLAFHAIQLSETPTEVDETSRGTCCLSIEFQYMIPEQAVLVPERSSTQLVESPSQPRLAAHRAMIIFCEIRVQPTRRLNLRLQIKIACCTGVSG